MKRRSFLALFGAVAGNLRQLEAQTYSPVIGFLGSANPDRWVARLNSFRKGLAAAGFVEGVNVTIDYRWADGRNDRLAELASDLVRRNVNVIAVIGNTPSVLAAKSATSTIPIVFRVAVNPVDVGLVANLSSPGANLTGITTFGVEVGPKRVEYLIELVPRLRRLAMLVNPTNPVLAEADQKSIPVAAAQRGIRVDVVTASTDHEIQLAIKRIIELGAEGLIIGPDAFFNSRNSQIADWTNRERLPAIAPYREFVEAGGLASYGGNINDASRQAGEYVGLILKGRRASELPILQPTRLELVLNGKTAKALGLAIPPTLFAFADEIIE